MTGFSVLTPKFDFCSQSVVFRGENSVGFKIKNVAMHEKACAEPTTTCEEVKRKWSSIELEILDVKCMFNV